MGNETSVAMPIWLDPEGGVATETSKKIQKLSETDACVRAQHPHWKGGFSIDDMSIDDLEAISAACLENDAKLSQLYHDLCPHQLSQTTFWTSYLSHVEFYLSEAGGGMGLGSPKNNDENHNENNNIKHQTTSTHKKTSAESGVGSGFRANAKKENGDKHTHTQQQQQQQSLHFGSIHMASSSSKASHLSMKSTTNASRVYSTTSRSSASESRTIAGTNAKPAVIATQNSE
mmetsp:Transcript_23251/g.41139  ORF Transcript_23251/g.41139 Transcript_23251/m.41139 type:complete len:231 (-) Transcript_23251:1254-1946(-)